MCFHLHQVYWLVEEDSDGPRPPGTHLVYGGAPSIAKLNQLNITSTNARYDRVSADRVR